MNTFSIFLQKVIHEKKLENARLSYFSKVSFFSCLKINIVLITPLECVKECSFGNASVQQDTKYEVNQVEEGQNMSW